MNSLLRPSAVAITHVPSPNMRQGQRTYVTHQPIDYPRALRQHEQYCQALRECGVNVRVLDVNANLPDAVFVEDTAIVLDEVAVLASMGTESRRAEPSRVEPELRKYRDVHRIELPATIEGGDVLRVGHTLFVGLSARTNPAGAKAIDEIVRHYGYHVVTVPVRGCLHLKTACTALLDETLLINPAWLDASALGTRTTTAVPETEPWGANVMLIGETVCAAADHAQTADLIRARGFTVRAMDISEFAKAEGGVTCLSLLIPSG